MCFLSVSRERSGRVTAARECSEETLCIIGDKAYFVAALENYIENNVFKASCLCENGVHYLGLCMVLMGEKSVTTSPLLY